MLFKEPLRYLFSTVSTMIEIQHHQTGTTRENLLYTISYLSTANVNSLLIPPIAISVKE
jgi:hypothetical protein